MKRLIVALAFIIIMLIGCIETEIIEPNTPPIEPNVPPVIEPNEPPVVEPNEPNEPPIETSKKVTWPMLGASKNVYYQTMEIGEDGFVRVEVKKGN